MIVHPLELVPKQFYIGNSNLHAPPYSVLKRMDPELWIQWCSENLPAADQLVVGERMIELLKLENQSPWGVPLLRWLLEIPGLPTAPLQALEKKFEGAGFLINN